MSYLHSHDRTDDHESYGFAADSEVVGFLNVNTYAPGTKEQGADPFNGEGGEIVYYIERTQTRNLPEVRDAYTVEYRCSYWANREDLENSPRDVSYEAASVLYYDSLESAQRKCDKLGQQDECYVFLFDGDRDLTS